MRGTTSVVRAWRDISKDEEITITYVINFDRKSRRKRRQMTQQTWGFKCECKICGIDEKVFPHLIASSDERRSIIIFIFLFFFLLFFSVGVGDLFIIYFFYSRKLYISFYYYFFLLLFFFLHFYALNLLCIKMQHYYSILCIKMHSA